MVLWDALMQSFAQNISRFNAKYILATKLTSERMPKTMVNCVAFLRKISCDGISFSCDLLAIVIDRIFYVCLREENFSYILYV